MWQLFWQFSSCSSCEQLFALWLSVASLRWRFFCFLSPLIYISAKKVSIVHVSIPIDMLKRRYTWFSVNIYYRVMQKIFWIRCLYLIPSDAKSRKNFWETCIAISTYLAQKLWKFRFLHLEKICNKWQWINRFGT